MQIPYLTLSNPYLTLSNPYLNLVGEDVEVCESSEEHLDADQKVLGGRRGVVVDQPKARHGSDGEALPVGWVMGTCQS